MDCYRTLKPLQRGGEERKGEEGGSGGVHLGPDRRRGVPREIFEMGRCVQKATTALKQLLPSLRRQELRRQYTCVYVFSGGGKQT